jgi:hypothetical protein
MSQTPYQELWIERQIARLKAVPQPDTDQLEELRLLEESLKERIENERASQNPVPPGK